MESCLVSMPSNFNTLVKNYFKDNLPDYYLESESSHGPHWEVIHSSGEIKITVFGDIGFEIEIYIEDTKFDLWQYDKSVNNAMKTTEKNIIYQLEILKRFLSSNNFRT